MKIVLLGLATLIALAGVRAGLRRRRLLSAGGVVVLCLAAVWGQLRLTTSEERERDQQWYVQYEVERLQSKNTRLKAELDQIERKNASSRLEERIAGRHTSWKNTTALAKRTRVQRVLQEFIAAFDAAWKAQTTSEPMARSIERPHRGFLDILLSGIGGDTEYEQELVHYKSESTALDSEHAREVKNWKKGRTQGKEKLEEVYADARRVVPHEIFIHLPDLFQAGISGAPKATWVEKREAILGHIQRLTRANRGYN